VVDDLGPALAHVFQANQLFDELLHRAISQRTAVLAEVGRNGLRQFLARGGFAAQGMQMLDDGREFSLCGCE
jgi:hypothetical protein